MRATQNQGAARRAALAMLVAVLPVASAACALGTPPHQHAPQPAATSPQPTPTGGSQVPIGVFTEGQGTNWSAVAAFSTLAGQHVRYVLSFLHSGQPFPTQLGDAAARHSAELVLQLLPAMSMQQVITGEDDGYLTSLAQQVSRYRQPVILSWAPEANGNWYSWGYTRTPASVYRAAWAHVIAQFAGVRNVVWMDTVNVAYEGSGPTAEYIVPGVSMIGIDGYYDHPGVTTFGGVFDSTLSQIRAVTDSPVMISETAITEAGNQTRDIPGLVAGVRADNLVGFIWFNVDLSYLGGIQGKNWTLTEAGATALRSALESQPASPASPSTIG